MQVRAGGFVLIQLYSQRNGSRPGQLVGRGLQTLALGTGWCPRQTGPPLYLDCVVQEDPVHRLPDGLHPSEGEGQIGQTTADFGSRQRFLEKI